MEIRYHCSFTINSTHAIVTGGKQGWDVSESTWWVDLATTTFTPGPSMKTKRRVHGCATFQYEGKTFGIASGGYDENQVPLDTTEIIDFDQENPTWTEGPKLPQKSAYLTLVKTYDGDTYALGGTCTKSQHYTDFSYDCGGRDRKRSSEVLKLECPGEDQIQCCQWIEMPEKLEFARKNHVSISIPESHYFYCTT